MNDYSRNNHFLSSIPPVTLNLLIINILIWLVAVVCTLSGGSLHTFGVKLPSLLGLHFFESDKFNPVQIFTYMFMHDTSSMMHILFNMFTLWMFGRLIERVWGSKRFLVFYLVCGVGAALVQEGVWALCWQHDYVSAIAGQNHLSYAEMKHYVELAIAQGDPSFTHAIAMYKNSMVTVGASGAIFGVLLGFAFTFPDLPMYLFFIPVPIKAKYVVIGYAVLEFFLGVSGSQASVAHFAHLGGMLFGLVMLLYWKHKGTLSGNRFG